ncbi:thiamine-phosphate kinase, partial [Candidatus Woesearchaeota archaeon]|nr:thiamine-phosphate kinase [Candidatus Woesearchaeota archaeon]
MAAQKLLTAGKIGEAGLIDRIRKRAGLRGLGMKGLRHKILVGIGDDAAVFKMGGKLGVATTDTINEGTHFRFPWLSPFDVGFKAMEASVSDVGAMGGKPLFALASLILPAHFPMHDFDRLYDGLLSSARRHQLSIIGGNISSGENISVTITALGEVERKNLCLRSDAKAGDFIFASGPLGGSSAGLHLFEKRIKGFAKSKMAYRRPRADFKKLDGLFHSINAMEDASDGLASAVSHICMASKVQGIIYGP